MKSSIYNFFLEDVIEDNKIIAYNSRTGALALINKVDFLKFNNFAKYGKNIDDEKLLNDLKYGGFVVDSKTNELNLIKLKSRNDRYDKSTLMLTIAPTSDCNFRCVYCYEKNSIKQSYMNDNTKLNILEYIREQSINLKKINVTWYGGEPLMNFNIIEDLTEEILKICQNKNIHYSANIVTNGYLLTKKY